MVQSKNCAKRVFLHVLVVLAIFMAFFPIFWVFLCSFKPSSLLYVSPPVWVFRPTIDNYLSAIRMTRFPLHAMNSIIIAISTTCVSLLVGSAAAYSFTRYKFRGDKNILFWILSTRMLPPIVTVIPLFMIFRNLGLLDTHLVLIIAYSIFNIPFVTWMMRGFFLGIPTELEEAAKIDGCSGLQAFKEVMLPLAAPGLFTTAIFCFIFSWNEFLFAAVLSRKFAVTLPVGISGYIEDAGVLWDKMLASSAIMMIPLIVFALAIQKYIVEGLTFGALKR